MRLRKLIGLVCSVMLPDTEMQMDQREKNAFFMKLWIVLTVAFMAGAFVGSHAP
jgi:hypothetical protein